MDLHETFEVRATARGADKGGLKNPGDRFPVTIRQFSVNWMVPATPADKKKMLALREGLDEYKAAAAAEAEGAAAAEDALAAKVAELEAKLAAAEKEVTAEKKRADKAEADLAALNKKIDEAQKKTAAAKSTTANKTT